MRIQELLLERQRSLFVGRARELDLLQDLVRRPGEDWHLLHVHGPGGIGKSTLLRLVAERIGRARAILVDGIWGFARPEDVLARVRQELVARGAMAADGTGSSAREVTAALNAYAAAQGGILLALDTFEKWNFVEDWLRDEWLPALDYRVRVCTAGRQRLLGPWQAGGWNLLVRHLELPPLAPCEVDEYGRRLGIPDGALDDLRRISGGHPLALSLAGPLILRHGRLDGARSQVRALVQQLMGAVLADVSDPLLHRCIEAAAVLRRFDQELLEAALGEPVPADRFRALCGLPFITGCGEYWMLHDSVRQWVLADVKARRPGTYARLRERAMKAVDGRRSGGYGRESEWLFDQLYLSGSDFMHDLLFWHEDDLEVQSLSAQDADAVEQLYRRYLRASGRPADRGGMLGLIRPLLALTPESFGALRKGGRLMAFCAVVPLTDRTVPVLACHPVAARAAQCYAPGKEQYYLGVAGYDPRTAGGLESLMARDLLRLLPRGGLVLGQVEETRWDGFFRLIGFERAPWLDAPCADGTVYRGYVLDLQTEPLHAKVLRLLRGAGSPPSRGTGPATERPVEPRASPGPGQVPETLVRSLRKALRHFDRLYARPDLVEPLRFLVGEGGEQEAGALTAQVQERIRRVVERLEAGSEAERRDGQILRLAFLEKRGSHERTAEQLHLSVPTYYRHLRLAVHRLAQELLRAAPD